jgi:hydrogenase-4 component B
MNPELLIVGVLLCLLGTASSVFLSLIASGKGMRRAALSVLSTATALGAIVSVAFFITPPPNEIAPQLFGIRFQFDTLTAIFFGLLNVVACAVSFYAVAYVERHASDYNVRRLDALLAIFILGMQGVLLASTPFAFLIFWEVMSLSSFFLVMADKKEESIRAALFYLIMTHLGAGAILAGFMLLSGGVIFADYGQLAILALHASPKTILLAFTLMLFGFGSKAGLWPFHVWLPEAHPQAPSHISALMSGVMLKMALYGFLRLVLSILPPIPAAWALPVIGLGLFSAVFGVLYAVIERDFKRLLAYSSIENLGLMFMMVGTAMYARATGLDALAGAALAAAVLHAVAHAIFKSGLFMGAGAVVSQLHTRDLEKMGGLARRMPKFSGAMLILALGAAALPPLSAFTSEWLFLQNVIAAIKIAGPFEQGLFILVLSGFAFVGGLAVFAMVKLFGIAFLAKPRSEHAAEAIEPSRSLAWPVFFMAALTIAGGLLAPAMLRTLGFLDIAGPTRMTSPVGSLTPISLLVVFMIIGAAIFLLRRLFSNAKNEREYHTWDCGQPITSAMEYTATAFSAPTRFFFRMLLHARKKVAAVPVVATNPWIARRTNTLEIRHIWLELLYVPVSRVVLFLSTRVRRLHNGVIQFYIALILAALVATLALAL